MILTLSYTHPIDIFRALVLIKATRHMPNAAGNEVNYVLIFSQAY